MPGTLRISILVLILLPAISLQAQDESYPVTIPAEHYARSVFGPDTGSAAFARTGNPDINIQLGTSFLFLGNDNYGFQNYVRPGISYDLSQRFRLTTGIQFSSERYMLAGNTNEGNLFNTPYNRVSVFASGEYLITEKVSVFGTAIKDLNGPQFSPMHPLAEDFKYQSLSVGVNYQLNKNINFGAEIRINNQPVSFFNDPYNSGRYRRPGSLWPDF